MQRPPPKLPRKLTRPGTLRGLLARVRADLALRAALEELDAPHATVPGWRLHRGVRLFAKDRAALLAADAPLRHHLLAARWEARRGLLEAGADELAAVAFDRREDRLAARYLRRRLDSDRVARDAERHVPLGRVAIGSKPNYDGALDAAERWRRLLAEATPRQRVLLQRWHADPDAPLADIARDLGIAPSTARTLIQRLRKAV